MLPTIHHDVAPQSPKSKTKALILLMIILVVATSGGVYYWQKLEAKKLATTAEEKVRNEMQTKVNESNNQISECQQKLTELNIASSTAKYDPLFPFINRDSAQDKAGLELGNKNHIIKTNILAEKTSIENDIVYYTDTSGKKRALVKSLSPDNTPGLDDLRRIVYTKAEISPNKQFIALSSYGYEWTMVEIFDVTTGQLHLVGLGGDVSNLASWLPDNKLEIIGSCGMGILCGTYRSINNEAPWIIDQYSTSTSK